jgi:ABC-type branched-subunit amino acid transport system substrate-binding protein
MMVLLAVGLLWACAKPDISAWPCSSSDDCQEGWLCSPTTNVCEQGMSGGVYGVSDNELVVGMSAAIETGQNKDIGLGMKAGIEAYFNYVNNREDDEGLLGVHGRKLRLDARDDGYEPDKAYQNVQALVSGAAPKVFALIGNVGTPTAEAILETMLEEQLIFFGPFTGAGSLRKSPPDRYVFNYRASYGQETAAQVNYLRNKVGVPGQNIGVLAQGDRAGERVGMDGYGTAGFNGVLKALQADGSVESQDDMHWATYERNTTDVRIAVESFLSWLSSGQRVAEPDGTIKAAVIMVPTHKSAGNFVIEMSRNLRAARTSGSLVASGVTLSDVEMARLVKVELTFLSVSFVGSNALATHLAHSASERGDTDNFCDGVIVSQVVPHHESRNLTGVVDYLNHLGAHDSALDSDFVSLEGYLAARIFVAGLERTGRALTPEAFIEALHTMNEIDVGIGQNLSFSADDHQASDQVWGTRFDDNCVVREFGAF